MDCYSGTTANPKGAMLSQDNVTWTCASAAETYGMVEGKEEVRATKYTEHLIFPDCPSAVLLCR